MTKRKRTQETKQTLATLRALATAGDKPLTDAQALVAMKKWFA